MVFDRYALAVVRNVVAVEMALVQGEVVVVLDNNHLPFRFPRLAYNSPAEVDTQLHRDAV